MRDSVDSAGDGGGMQSIPFIAYVLFEAGLAPLALVLGWALGQHPLADFAWDADAAFNGAAAAIPMLVFLGVTVRWPVGPLGRLKAFFDRELAPIFKKCDWHDLALISVAAGVGEEMLFRGVIQGAIARALGSPAAGLGLAAVLFGVMHAVSVWYALVATLLGAYLGLVWLVSGNLLTVIVAHALYDFTALVILLRDREPAESREG